MCILRLLSHKATSIVWLETNIFGCRFHLGQSWHRNNQKQGLQTTYRNKSPVRRVGSFLRSFFRLLFLPPDMVEQSFAEDFGPAEPKDERVERFCDYLYTTYIAQDAEFPHSMWAAYSASRIRTTNACEGFHSKLNGMFYHSHPNIFILVDVLLEVQEFPYIEMKAPASSNDPRSPEEVFISETMSKWDAREIHCSEFVKTASRKFLPAKLK